MTVPRSQVVDLSVTPWYHCTSRCVRQAFLLEEPSQASDGTVAAVINRKAWLDDRLKYLTGIFAISVGGYSTMTNHMHALLRIDAEIALAWSDVEVTRRWLTLYPLRDAKRQPIPLTDELIEAEACDKEYVEDKRGRLMNLGWFMKCLKEPLARIANKEDGCVGSFFQGRYKAVAVVDAESLLSVCAYIDLNPVAAGMVPTPETSPHTSIKERVDHVVIQGRQEDLRACLRGSVEGSKAAAGLEEGLWLVPIEDRRGIDSERMGILAGCTLGNYLMLVEQTGRMLREGKASISAELADIFERLGTTAERWIQRAEKLRRGRPYGSFMAASRESLERIAKSLSLARVINVGC